MNNIDTLLEVIGERVKKLESSNAELLKTVEYLEKVKAEHEARDGIIIIRSEEASDDSGAILLKSLDALKTLRTETRDAYFHITYNADLRYWVISMPQAKYGLKFKNTDLLKAVLEAIAYITDNRRIILGKTTYEMT